MIYIVSIPSVLKHKSKIIHTKQVWQGPTCLLKISRLIMCFIGTIVLNSEQNCYMTQLIMS